MMKKSRPIEISLRQSGHDVSRHPGKPPTHVAASLKKPSSCKSPCTRPNYMKSTSSFEARKEEATQVSCSKQHKVAKTSSFKVVRTLSKAPSFKHCARTITTTCSSTLKDAKFPPYLKLKPGATESEGRSVKRVCSYNHCSLNGDHHNRAPPLKRFMSSKRRLLKTLKVNRPEILPPRKGKAKRSECKGRGVGDQNEDFFVEIYVPDRGVDTHVSESVSDGPRSEIDQSEETNLSDLSFCPTNEYYPPTPVQSATSVSLDAFFCETSDREWEEEKTICTSGETYVQSNQSNDQDKPDFETVSSVDYEYPPYFYDEIVEYLCFSDADSLPDTQTGERNIEEPVMVEEKYEMNSGPKNEVAEEDSTQAEEATVHATEQENESADKQGTIISDLVEKIPEAQNEDLDSYQEPVGTDGDESNKYNYNINAEIREDNPADPVLGEGDSIKEITGIPQITENSDAKEGICMDNNDDRDGTDQSEDVATLAGQEETEAANSEEESDSIEFKFDSKNNVEEEKTAGMEDSKRTEEVGKCNSNNRESDANQESCNNLKRGMRCKKEDEYDEERGFNPRGPNFLEIEPDPEAEKVDLRHQEMDDRRNAEEWMLDHALQKTVNQLTPARKRKVALLVEAFEAVLPLPKVESSIGNNSSGFDHERLIQACLQ
ncbi:hypothetical protein SOVF_075530 [Spinacia oleracea]|nr:hypothetical protein SOVF_075530 [Spinacia oleracea]